MEDATHESKRGYDPMLSKARLVGKVRLDKSLQVIGHCPCKGDTFKALKTIRYSTHKVHCTDEKPFIFCYDDKSLCSVCTKCK